MKDNFTIIAEQMSCWNWQTFFQSACNLGGQFNDRTWRFLKAEVLGIALEAASNGEAEYVDAPGYDLFIKDVKIEIKTQEKAFTKKLDTASIRMKNTMGENQTFEKTFDYLVVANSEPPYLAALAPWTEVYDGHKMTGDAVTSKIEKRGLKFLTSESGVVLPHGFPSSVSLKKYVRGGIRNWVDEIKTEVERTLTLAEQLLRKIPSFKRRMKKADPKLYEDCVQAETNLIEEFSMEHFSQFMHRVSLPINGDNEKMLTPIVRPPAPTLNWTHDAAEEIPNQGVTVNGEDFTKDEVEILIRVSQWRFAPHSESD